LYAVVFAFTRRHATKACNEGEAEAYAQPATETTEAIEAWEASIMPYTPLQSNNAYYGDDLTNSDWSAKLASVRSVDAGARRWVPAASPPRVALDACMQSVARSLGPGWVARKVSVKGAWEDTKGGGVAWDVVACFHRAGKARGWCARLRVVADMRNADPRMWAFYASDASPIGILPESSVWLKPYVAEAVSLQSSPL
jgi:hypothetical protein